MEFNYVTFKGLIRYLLLAASYYDNVLIVTFCYINKLLRKKFVKGNEKIRIFDAESLYRRGLGHYIINNMSPMKVAML